MTPAKYELQVTIYITSDRGDRLNVNETVTLAVDDFLDMAKVLGQFHDLAQSLNARKRP